MICVIIGKMKIPQQSHCALILTTFQEKYCSTLHNIKESMNALEKLIASNYEGAMSYTQYRKLIDDLHEQGKVTGPNQDPNLLEYSKLNVHRMDRWDKHTHLADETIAKLKAVDKPIDVLVITEGWCGDAAQIVPVVQKMLDENPNFRSHYILRDDNLEIMDMFLTNGKSRSIPIFVLFENGKVLGKYGPRPKPSQELIDQLKAEGADFEVVKEKLHLWYARDKHRAIESEFVAVLERI